MRYVRKISENAWFIMPELDADAISELGTINHDLSVWEVPDNLSNIDDIALALAMSRSKIEEMYIVLLSIDEIKKDYNWDVQFNKQLGNSFFTAINGAHTNFEIETFWHQGFLAEYIKKKIANSQNYKYYDVLTLQTLLYEAVKKGILLKDEVKKRGGDWKKALADMEVIYGKV